MCSSSRRRPVGPLVLSFLCLFLSSFVAGEHLLLRRPLIRNKLSRKTFRLKDTDFQVFSLTDTKPAQDISNCVPRRLLRPFEAVLRRSPAKDQPEIETEKLIDACRELQTSMIAVGQGRTAAEIDRNLKKVEALHRMAPRGRRETLRALLEYEKELGVHGQDGRLKDPSGAMGLLWIRRSLAFQERMYTYILDRPVAPTHEAALKAYHETLEPYHGKALQMVYSMALKKITPNRHEMLQKLCALPENRFGAAEENATAHELRKLVETWKPVSFLLSSSYSCRALSSKSHFFYRLIPQLLNSWEETFHTLGLEDTRKV